jgi:hypothetical protein
MEDDLVKLGKNVDGQVRILEAVIASIIVFIAFSAAFYFIYSTQNIFAQEAIDLNRLAYNLLHQIAESGIIEKTIEEKPGGIEQLKIALQELLPANIYFNLTIKPINPSGELISASNAPAEAFKETGEVASASIIYTSKRGNIYHMILKLTRAGLW